MKLKNFLISGLFLLLISLVNAQSTVKIIDLIVTHVVTVDNQQQGNTTILNIRFKIKNVEQASKAYIYFGTVQDANDVLSLQADFVNNSGIYYLDLNGEQTEVNGYAAQINIELTQQQESTYNYITLFVEDNNGEITSKLYF